ncbi:hypothetical protein SAMN05444581_1398 [Methylocapsa palsarum]|uniref:Uncharacterized protein n=1 Tax=Methylocapsa palsarum TaxID=1612308 RepID=A0A1I4D7P3_9HYPH|nr:hypothetical protein SAMN05444581_1398 [Methylocapsa palsarum]
MRPVKMMATMPPRPQIKTKATLRHPKRLPTPQLPYDVRECDSCSTGQHLSLLAPRPKAVTAMQCPVQTSAGPASAKKSEKGRRLCAGRIVEYD